MSQQNEALWIKRQLSTKECRNPERWPAAKKPGRPRAPRATDAPIRKLREQGVGMHAIRQKLGCWMGEFSRGAAGLWIAGQELFRLSLFFGVQRR